MAGKNRKLSPTDIKVKKTPMPRRTISTSKQGKKFNMVFSKFVEQLFILNCKYPPSKKMTDGEIGRQIRLEYRHVQSILDSFSEDSPALSTEVATLRSRYNRGFLIPSQGPPEPELTAFCYDEQGRAVNPRYNNPRPLTPEDIKVQKDKTEARRKLFLIKSQTLKNDIYPR